jgi:hypothetical protein
VYSDEVWTGIEYQVAAHLIFEGFVDEGLEIVRAVRSRHDGIRRNPWNEVECGNHYARSLASWGVLLALTGVRADAVERTLSLSPRLAAFRDGELRTIVTTGSGWGELTFRDGVARLLVHGGRIDADELRFDHPDGARFGASHIHLRPGDVLELVPAYEPQQHIGGTRP